MDAQSSLHQKPREACITEDIESVDLGWFENTKLNRVKNGTRCLLQVGILDWESPGTSPSMTHKGYFVKQWQKFWRQELKEEIHPYKEATNGGTSPFSRPSPKSTLRIEI